MAIIDELGVGVSIKVGDKPLVEYDDPSPASAGDENMSEGDKAIKGRPIVCTKYIESQDNTYFTILAEATDKYSWPCKPKNFALTFRCYIDGERAAAKFVRPVKEVGKRRVREIAGREEFTEEDEKAKLYKFRFTALTLGTHSPFVGI